jgi:hypothetical protein
MTDRMTLTPMRNVSFGQILFLTFFLLLIFALLFSHAMLTTLNHDEYQFVAGGQLLAERGLLPYRDYPFLHMPYMVVVNGLIFMLTDDHFLAARLLTAVCGLLSAGLVYLNVFRFSAPVSMGFRMVLSCAATLLFVTNTAYLDANGRVLNHALPNLLSLLALEVFFRGLVKNHNRFNLLIVGVLVGLALGTRLTYALLIPAFALTLLLLPLRAVSSRRNQRLENALKDLLIFGSGILTALLPVMLLAATAPKQFLFGNFVYIHLNTGYRQAVGYGEAMTLGGKLAYFAENVLSDPINIVLYVLAIGFSIWVFNKWMNTKEYPSITGILVGLLSLCMFISAFGPTPTWSQYFFAPLPFLVLGGFWGAASLSKNSKWAGWVVTGLILILTLTSPSARQAARELIGLREPADWVPLQVSQFARQISQVLPEGKVLTLAPIYPLQAGLDTYEMFAVGPLVWRSAHILSTEKRQEYRIIAMTELEGFLEDQPPAALLLGVEDRYDGFWIDNPGALEDPLRQYAEAHGYTPHELTPGFGEGAEVLWVK